MRAAYAASKSVGNTYLSNASKGTAAGSNKRRDHLKELMLTKIVSICNHHNWGPIDDAAREYASRQVDVLLRTGKVSGADLHRIASHIRAGSRPQRETQAHASVRQQKDAMSDVAAQSDVSSMRGTATAAHASHVSPAARTVASKDDSECDLWARMLRKDVEAWQSETQQHRQHRRQRMEEQRLALDKQIEAAQTLKIQTAEQEKFYAKQIAVQLEEWNHEQSRLDEKRKQTNLAEKKMRDDQLQVMRTKKAQEDRQRKHEDEQIIRKLHDDIKQEQVDKQHQKARARQEVHRYIEVNRAQNQAKERVIRDEAEMDRMHQLHHMAKLEQQDKERSEALKKIHDKQSRQVHIAQQLAASIGEKAADDERRADTEQRRKMEQMMKQEQEKEERAQHEREKMRSYLSQQIAEKEKARASRLKRQLEEKDLLARELLQAEQQETERRRAKKNKDMNHRKLIESQIQEKQQRKDVIMSDTEKRLNMKRLHTINPNKAPLAPLTPLLQAHCLAMSMKYGGNVKGEKDACMREMDIVCRLSEAARRSKDMDARQLAAVNDFDLGGAVAAARQGDSASIKAACSVTVVAIDVAYSHYAGVTYHTQLPKLTSPRSVVVLLRNGVSYADLKAPRIKSHSTPCVSENGLNTTMSTSPTGAAMSPLCAEQDFTQRYNLLQELRRQYAQLTALVSSDDVCDYLMELYEGTLPTPSVGRAPSPPRTARSAKVVSDTCSDASSVKDRMGEARMKFLREKIDRDAQSIERRRAKERAADDRRRALREFMEKKNQRRNQKLAMFEAKRKENLDRQQRIKGQHDKEIFDRLVSSEQHINLTTALRQAKLKEIATLKQRREDEARRFLTEEMRSRIDEGEKHSQAEQERVARQHRYKLEVSDAKEQERRSQLQTHRQQTLLRCVGNEATRKTMCLAKRLETEQRLQRFHDEAQAEADQRTEQFQELEEVRNLKKEAVESWTRHHSCTLAERYSDKLSRTQKCLDRVQAQREACQQQALYRNSLKDAKVERMKQQMEYQRLLTLDRINDKTSKVQLLQDQRESDKREHQKMLMIQRKKQEMALRTRAQMSEPRDKAWFACCGVAACFVAGLSYRCFTRRASPFDRVNHLHPEGLIEVERKIEVDATLRDRIVKQGGVREGTVRIVDTYYDTWCFELCYQDAWLRRRNVDGSVRWEFKVGPGIASTKHTAASYTEYVEEEAFDKLREFLKHPFRDVSELLKNSFIQPLVRVATTRESYAYRGHTIDIDVTDEGHIVAEVEHVVKSRDQIPAARDSIDEVCRSLSIPDGSPPPPGKMEAALKAQRRDLLARLQALRQGQSA